MWTMHLLPYKFSFPIEMVALWPIAVVVIWAIWNFFRERSGEKAILRSLSWPETQGGITRSKVVWGHYEVRYEYTVSAKRFTGTFKIPLFPAVPSRSSRAQKYLEELKANQASYPVGKKVVVRFNPNKPGESVLYRVGEISQTVTPEKKTEAPDFFVLN